MTFDAKETKEWVKRFRSGSPEVFTDLYRVYGERIYRFSYRLCERSADAEDLTQEVFVAAYQSRESFQGRSSVLTWLYRIALYRWRRLYGGKRDQPLPLEESLEAPGADPALSALNRMGLERAFATLSNDLWEAFLLVKIEGWKYREAGEVLGIPQGTVQFRVHEAVKQLRTALGDEELSTPKPASFSPLEIPQKEVTSDAV